MEIYEKYVPECEKQSYVASALVEASGQVDCADYMYEWGEAPDRAQCEAFVASWVKFLEELT